MRKLLLHIFCLLIITNHISAQVNTTSLLDTSYNHVGYRVNSENISQGIICQDMFNDGSFIGIYVNGLISTRNVFKYTPTGSIDNSFGSNGILPLEPTDFSTNLDSATHFTPKQILALPSNKTILLSTITYWSSLLGYYTKLAVFRLNPNGSLDSSFANNGIFLLNQGDSLANISAQHLIINNNNKLTILGNIGPSGDKKRIVFRLNQNGTLDTTFNHSGYRTFYDTHSIKIFENQTGEIIMPYWSGDTNNYVRITDSNGDSLSTYSIIHFNTGFMSNIYMDNNNQLYYIGFKSDGNGNDNELYIYRFKSDFSVDSLFGINGLLTITDSNFQLSKHNIKFSNDAIYSASVAFRPIYNVPDSLYLESYLLTTKIEYNGNISNNYGYNGRYYLKLPHNISYGFEPYAYPLQNRIYVSGGIDVYNYDSLNTYYNFFVAKLFNDTVSIILGIIDNPIVSQTVTAYPNPVQNSTINLNYELQNKQDISISFFDINGKLLGNLLNKQPRAKGQNTEQLQLPTYPATGTYIITIQAGTYSKSVKIVVQ